MTTEYMNVLSLKELSLFGFDSIRMKCKWFANELKDAELKLVQFIIGIARTDQEFSKSDYFPFGFDDLLDVRVEYKDVRRKIVLSLEFESDEIYSFVIEMINDKEYFIHTNFSSEDKVLGCIKII